MTDGVAPPEVTVVIPTRNRWPLLRHALRTALWQEDVELEVIVVDDGSTDETREGLGDVGDPRLRVLTHASSLGVARARNDAIEAARAPWLAFLDDDDLWAPRKLREQLHAAGSADDVSAVYCGAIFVDGEGVPLHVRLPAADNVRKELLHWNVVGSPSGVLARTDEVRAAGGFDETLSIVADWDLWIRLAERGRLVDCQAALIAYTLHPENLSSDLSAFRAELERLHRKHLQRDPPRSVTADPIRLARLLAGGQRRAGDRLAAARTYLASGVRDRDAPNLLRGLTLLLPTERMLAGLRRRREHVEPVEWLERALRT